MRNFFDNFEAWVAVVCCYTLAIALLLTPLAIIEVMDWNTWAKLATPGALYILYRMFRESFEIDTFLNRS